MPKTLLIIIITAIIAFIAGYSVKGWLYKDICLDMGGGANPNNHDICVIEK